MLFTYGVALIHFIHMTLKMSGRKNIAFCFFSFQHASGLLSQGWLWFLFSLFQHIRSILDVIYPPSSGVTKCYLTNYWLPSPSSHLAGRGCVWQCVCVMKGKGREGGMEKKVGLGEWGVSESHTDRLNRGGRWLKRLSLLFTFPRSSSGEWRIFISV